MGAGSFGAWTAWHLAHAGNRVLLLDAWGPAHSRASSGGESRIIRMGYGANEIYTRMAMRSLALWQELFSRTAQPLFHRTGVMLMARDDHPYSLATRDTLARVGVPMEILPAVHDNSHHYGATSPDLFGAAIPITGLAGDQQAALFGQACFDAGMAKSTYGTGCFMLLNTGEQALVSQNRLLTTLAYRLNGQATYALEGSIFVAGAAVKWLRDSLGGSAG